VLKRCWLVQGSSLFELPTYWIEEAVEIPAKAPLAKLQFVVWVNTELLLLGSGKRS
jgi:hypothetical protein